MLAALRKVFEYNRPSAPRDHRSHSAQGKRRRLQDLGLGAIACVPMSVPPWPRGLLAVSARKEGGAFTELDLEILSGFADHAAVALAGVPLTGPIREIDGSPLPETETEERHILAQLDKKVAGWATRESRPHRLTPIG
jgi:hypothetical protein